MNVLSFKIVAGTILRTVRRVKFGLREKFERLERCGG